MKTVAVLVAALALLNGSVSAVGTTGGGGTSGGTGGKGTSGKPGACPQDKCTPAENYICVSVQTTRPGAEGVKQCVSKKATGAVCSGTTPGLCPSFSNWPREFKPISSVCAYILPEKQKCQEKGEPSHRGYVECMRVNPNTAKKSSGSTTSSGSGGDSSSSKSSGSKKKKSSGSSNGNNSNNNNNNSNNTTSGSNKKKSSSSGSAAHGSSSGTSRLLVESSASGSGFASGTPAPFKTSGDEQGVIYGCVDFDGAKLMFESGSKSAKLSTMFDYPTLIKDNCVNPKNEQGSQVVCSGRGTCSPKHEGQMDYECMCTTGYGGKYCQKIDSNKCDSAAQCEGQGTCNLDKNECECPEGTTGDQCGKCDPKAATVCSGHGTCGSDGVCKCEEGWNGDVQCSVKPPPLKSANKSDSTTDGSQAASKKSASPALAISTAAVIVSSLFALMH